ncbi:MAG: Wzz/FepE/Etk N-terminal domain-containing protein [Marinifilaceae bacterium]
MNEVKDINTTQEDELDLIRLAKTLWNGRRTVIHTTIIFMVVGLIVAILSPKEYTASTTMMPQAAGGKKLGGSLGGLAAMAGINLGSMGSGGEIPPTLYPKIVSSIPFQKAMMQTQLTVNGQEQPVSFAQYYLELSKPSVLGYVKKYTIGLPGLIISTIKGGGEFDKQLMPDNRQLLSISLGEKKLIKILSAQLSLNVNDKDGYVSLSARMPEALAAAQLAQKAQELLQNSIIEFKSKKAKDQLAFVEERYVEKQKDFEIVQQKLAQFRDRNRNVSTAVAQAELERLQAEYNMVYGVYSELAKQLESQRIQVKEDTPVFTILEPVSIPIDKSKPKRSMILILWTVLGGFVGIGIVFGKEFLAGIKDKWFEEDF